MTGTPQPGAVFWITGLSGAGKTTLGHALKERLTALGRNVVLLDGDSVRELLLDTGGMDRQSRLQIAHFNGRLCNFLSMQGLDVVCATVSLFHAVRAWNRRTLNPYFEVFLDTPLAHLEAADSKGIYGRARRGEIKDVVGIDIAPEWPTGAHVVLTLKDREAPARMADRILRQIDFFVSDKEPTYEN